jgi:hypothetical protein
MPLPALERLYAPNALPSSEIEIDSDVLSPIGITRGSTIEYFAFEERFMDRFCHFTIKATRREAIARICFDCQPVRIKHRGEVYSLEDVEIHGVFVIKPKLRLVKT